MANVAWGEAECYISIEAECRVLYFTYNTWQGNDLWVIKNFLSIITYTNCVEYVDTSHQIQTNSLFGRLLSYPSLYWLRKSIWNPSGSLPYTYLVLYQHCFRLWSSHAKFFIIYIYTYRHLIHSYTVCTTGSFHPVLYSQYLMIINLIV